jgi:hypothetical protein
MYSLCVRRRMEAKGSKPWRADPQRFGGERERSGEPRPARDRCTRGGKNLCADRADSARCPPLILSYSQSEWVVSLSPRALLVLAPFTWLQGQQRGSRAVQRGCTCMPPDSASRVQSSASRVWLSIAAFGACHPCSTLARASCAARGGLAAPAERLERNLLT